MRKDISDYIVHWTKGAEAFTTLEQILYAKKIIAGTSDRKAFIPTICFTETPIEEFHKIQTRYSPFGVYVSKRWAFAQGARPVIYERDSEFFNLPENLKWRHVRYEPDGDPVIDFTWEREWRINKEELFLDPSEFFVILPDAQHMNAILSRHQETEQMRIYAESIGYGDHCLWQSPRPFEYGIRINIL